MTPQLRPLVVAALLAPVLVAACSGPTGPSNTAVSTDQIAGTWTLTAQQPSGQGEVVPPAGVVFSIEFVDGRAAVRADCNRCNGAAAVGDSSITVGPTMACTRAFCPSAPLDDTFLKLLSGESTATIDGNTLTLRSDRGVLRFRR
jgi:heat shock protein HslJ